MGGGPERTVPTVHAAGLLQKATVWLSDSVITDVGTLCECQLVEEASRIDKIHESERLPTILTQERRGRVAAIRIASGACPKGGDEIRRCERANYYPPI